MLFDRLMKEHLGINIWELFLKKTKHHISRDVYHLTIISNEWSTVSLSILSYWLYSNMLIITMSSWLVDNASRFDDVKLCFAHFASFFRHVSAYWTHFCFFLGWLKALEILILWIHWFCAFTELLVALR